MEFDKQSLTMGGLNYDEYMDTLANPYVNDALKSQLMNEYNNEAALFMASTANDFEARQAQIDRDFQERMSNTQYQRSIQDLQKAGLNPALAYTQGPAGNLSGSSASSAKASPSTSSVKDGNKMFDFASSMIGKVLDGLFGMLS